MNGIIRGLLGGRFRLSRGIETLATSMVSKTATIFKNAGMKTGAVIKNKMTAATIKNAWERDVGMKAARGLYRGGGFLGRNLAKPIGRGALYAGRKIAKSKTAMGGLLTVGAVGMMGVAFMNGANNAARDIVLERYMADQRFARNMVMQSRVGASMGTNRMNRMGSTMGLSNALSRTRHGASY